MSNKKSDMGKPKSVLMGVIGFIILVLADQWTKKMAVLRLKDQDPIVLIKNVFELYYLENRGAAFGIFQGKRVIFLIITIIYTEVCHTAWRSCIDCGRSRRKFY